ALARLLEDRTTGFARDSAWRFLDERLEQVAQARAQSAQDRVDLARRAERLQPLLHPCARLWQLEGGVDAVHRAGKRFVIRKGMPERTTEAGESVGQAHDDGRLRRALYSARNAERPAQQWKGRDTPWRHHPAEPELPIAAALRIAGQPLGKAGERLGPAQA